MGCRLPTNAAWCIATSSRAIFSCWKTIQVKIIDFGVAHMADSDAQSAPKGTLLYMAPEQIQLKPATALSDILRWE